MKNPLFQVISPTTALVTNSSHITLPVIVRLREHRRPVGQRLGGELSFEVTIAAIHSGVLPEQRRAENAEHHADESQHRPRQWRSSPTL